MFFLVSWMLNIGSDHFMLPTQRNVMLVLWGKKAECLWSKTKKCWMIGWCLLHLYYILIFLFWSESQSWTNFCIGSNIVSRRERASKKKTIETLLCYWLSISSLDYKIWDQFCISSGNELGTLALAIQSLNKDINCKDIRSAYLCKS